MSSDDEHGLPPIRQGIVPAQHSATTMLRKRSRGYDSSNSSDAPFFSSDDLAEASLDNYESPRKKKQYRRPWWEHDSSVTARRDPLKRFAKRTKDSGVFMSSDSSSNDDGFGVEGLKIAGLKRPEVKSMMPVSPRPRKPLQGEPLAQKVILRCLETNDQVVELSNLGLHSLTGETIRPLRDLISLPKARHQPGTEDAYQSFASRLKIFLSVNMLHRIPGELVNLSNLTVLSLRNNQISKLPHSIGKLHNLVELNLAGNKLRWLPWELLGLVERGKLTNLHVLPNPLIQAIPIEGNHSGRWSFAKEVASSKRVVEALMAQIQCLEDQPKDKLRMEWLVKIQQTILTRNTDVAVETSPERSWSVDGTTRQSTGLGWKKDPIYLGSTLVTFFDFDGSVPRSAHSPPSRTPNDLSHIPVGPPQANKPPNDSRGNRASRVSSLFELALKTSGEWLLPSELDKFLPQHCPDNIRNMAEELKEVVEEGGRECSVCRRSFVVPGAEWIEYWHYAPDCLQFSYEELFLPFLRRSCSWVCAMEVVDGWIGTASTTCE